MTNLGPLTTTYTAISSKACQSLNLATDTEGFWLERGDHTLSGCFPANFTPLDAYYYSPGICQEGYTYACTAGVGGLATTAATCCPSGFTCRTTRSENDNAACQSILRSDSSYIGDIVAYPDGLSSTTTTLIEAGETVYAPGVLVRRATTDAEWNLPSTNLEVTTTKSETLATSIESTLSSSGVLERPNDDSNGPTDDSAAQTGLSTGAKTGIGIGAITAVFLFVGGIAAIQYRRKRELLNREGPSRRGLRCELDEQRGSRFELEERRGVHEINAHREPAELD
ncbi:hypothetical protein F5Y10DRAFT_285559 [Nemania abortiva]|nr:hypothetical protein F5Y10DRAFT_285559 [Nemania abortiva]